MKDPYPDKKNPISWVSTDWLLKHHDDDDVIIIDCQPNIHDYIKMHIPNAVYVNPALFRIPKNGIPGKFVPKEVAQALFRRIGLKKNMRAVIYTHVGEHKGWGDGLEQTMVSFVFSLYGHKKVSVLDGGMTKWKKEDKPVTQKFPIGRFEASDFKAKYNDDYIIEYDEFKKVKDNKDVIFFDARPAGVYEGKGPWPKAGHIPGAINLPWKKVMDDNNPRLLKPKEEIEKIVKKAGASKDKMIICSCGTGREATAEFILFKFFLEYPKVKLFDGSFTEWTAYPDNATITGSKPK
ncbi:MAG: sulfurtransferase [Promethearchaeota archaeon]|jgi:thiosulfate/3-mercaptopyruvate sulfurtransferase|nr:MAG: sulfurtransferase [Candidatus Lokiarchaeota archaeon]